MSKRTAKLWHHIAISILITVLILCCISLSISGKKRGKVHEVVTNFKSENLQFLVRRRITSTVVMEKEEKSTIWGKRIGLLLGEVTVVYGFDLHDLTDDDIDIKKDKTVVYMGEPEILSFSIDNNSIRFFSKGSGMQYFKNIGENAEEKQMMNEFAAAAKRYFVDRNLLPERDEMLQDLQRQLKLMNLNIELR